MEGANNRSVETHGVATDIDLITIIQTGTIQERDIAFEELSRRYLKHLYFVANKHARPFAPVDDLVQLGLMGLFTAAQTFDPVKGTNYITHARPIAEGMMLTHLRNALRQKRSPLQEAFSLDDDKDGFRKRYCASADSITSIDEQDWFGVALERLMQRLIEEEQDFVRLFLSGLNLREIAELSGYSASKASQLLATVQRYAREIAAELDCE